MKIASQIAAVKYIEHPSNEDIMTSPFFVLNIIALLYIISLGTRLSLVASASINQPTDCNTSLAMELNDDRTQGIIMAQSPKQKKRELVCYLSTFNFTMISGV